MSQFPTAMVSESAPLPKLADETAQDWQANLHLRGYEVRHGLTPELVDEIGVMATEALIKKYCPNDAAARFGSQDLCRTWLAQDGGKAAFVLLNTAERHHRQLVGYGWTGPRQSSQVPGGETTFAIRIGRAARGQHLSRGFAALIIAGTEQCYGGRNFWLETWASNQRAVHTYRALGFQTVRSVAAAVGVRHGEPLFDTRLFMALP